MWEGGRVGKGVIGERERQWDGQREGRKRERVRKTYTLNSHGGRMSRVR